MLPCIICRSLSLLIMFCRIVGSSAIALNEFGFRAHKLKLIPLRKSTMYCQSQLLHTDSGAVDIGNTAATANSRPGGASQVKIQVIVLSGATSVGKSAVAMELCKVLNAEIIVADSVQVTRHMNIGSNKPSLEDQSLVQHHLIDIIDPSDKFSSGDFARQAKQAILDVINRGKVPLVVGGSTMWLDWLLRGLPDAPKAKAETVKYVNDLLAPYRRLNNWSGALEILRALDDRKATKVLTNDWYRLHRYLEVTIDEGRRTDTIDDGSDSSAGAGTGDPEGKRRLIITEFEVDFRTFFLTEDREHLYHVIDRRCVEMLSAGLMTEVYELLLHDVLLPQNSVCRAIGYRQAIIYLSDRKIVENDMVAFMEFLRTFATVTRNYAKRQMKWFRVETDVLFLRNRRTDVDSGALDVGAVVNELMHWIEVPEAEYKDQLSKQLNRTKAMHLIRSMRKIPVEFAIADDDHRLVLATLLYEKNLQRAPPEMRPEDTPRWMAELFDPRLGVTPNDIGTMEAKWTADELDLRVVEENKSKLRGFGSRLMSPPKGSRDAALYQRLVKQCDEYRKTLCTEKRAVMAEFQAQLQQVADEVD